MLISPCYLLLALASDSVHHLALSPFLDLIDLVGPIALICFHPVMHWL